METAKNIILTIQDEAIATWGHRWWLASLVQKYCEVEQNETGNEIEPDDRRTTIKRIFQTYATTTDTAQRLARCVNGQLRLVAGKQTYTDIISGIEAVAQQKWGEDWKVDILHAYCEIEGRETGTMPNWVNRRTTIRRIWQKRNTTLETACWLAAAVGAEMQMVIQRVEVKRF